MAAKVFEVNDVLPATTQLRISYDCTSYGVGVGHISSIGSTPYLKIEFMLDGDFFSFIRVYLDNVLIESLDYTTDGYITDGNFILDTSTMEIDDRTIDSIVAVDGANFYWEDLNAPSGYTITFNSNGGTSISDIEEATELPTLPIPTKSGYKFVAWYYESNFQTRAKAGDTIEANTTLYAKWHNLRTLFTGIANAIRSKDGTSGNIRDLDFDDRIKQIQGAIEITQAEYDALGTKDSNTYYLIVEE